MSAIFIQEVESIKLWQRQMVDVGAQLQTKESANLEKFKPKADEPNLFHNLMIKMPSKYM